LSVGGQGGACGGTARFYAREKKKGGAQKKFEGGARVWVGCS